MINSNTYLEDHDIFAVDLGHPAVQTASHANYG